MNRELLDQINRELPTRKIKGKPYVEVKDRVAAFNRLLPDASLETDVLKYENGKILTKTTITYKAEDGTIVKRTAIAEETQGSTNVNKTSYVENCETSSVGRALAFLGIGIDTSIASYEEVENARLNQNPDPNEWAKKAYKAWKQKGETKETLIATFGTSRETTEDQWKEIYQRIINNQYSAITLL